MNSDSNSSSSSSSGLFDYMVNDYVEWHESITQRRKEDDLIEEAINIAVVPFVTSPYQVPFTLEPTYQRPGFPLTGSEPRPPTTFVTVPYSEFLSKINGNQVQKVEVDGVHIMFKLKNEGGSGVMEGEMRGSGSNLQDSESPPTILLHPNSSSSSPPSFLPVLELGYGNSQLSDEMYKNGIKNITCTDLSPITVEKVQKRLLLKEFKEIKAMVADMLDLPFADGSFMLLLRKEQWMYCSWTVVIRETQKLKPLARSWQCSKASTGCPLFEAPDFTWSMKWSTFGDGFHYFFYTLKKDTRSLNSYQPCERLNLPSICLYQDELEGEDFLFRTNIDEPKDN
uniref:Methyltransferase domain-containing protein n=1 Tax=Chenopodium quinoa TaxID=63459 RepID=A0A803KPI6_CHEQI